VLRVLAGGWEVDREVFCKGLDQVFVEQPQLRKVPTVWRTNCRERRFVFICAMMYLRVFLQSLF